MPLAHPRAVGMRWALPRSLPTPQELRGLPAIPAPASFQPPRAHICISPAPEMSLHPLGVHLNFTSERLCLAVKSK